MSRYDTSPPPPGAFEFMRRPPEVHWARGEPGGKGGEPPADGPATPWPSSSALRNAAPHLVRLLLRARGAPDAFAVGRDVSYPPRSSYATKASVDWLLADAWSRLIFVNTLHWRDDRAAARGNVRPDDPAELFRDVNGAIAEASQRAAEHWDAGRLAGEHAAHRLNAGSDPVADVYAVTTASDSDSRCGNPELPAHYWGRAERFLAADHGRVSVVLMDAPPPRDVRIFRDIWHSSWSSPIYYAAAERVCAPGGDPWIKFSVWHSAATVAVEAFQPRGVARTDPGRQRAENQDVALFDSSLGLALVADGMGGESDGAAASAEAVRAFTQHLKTALADSRTTTPETMGKALDAAGHAANAAVYALARSAADADGRARTMGATLTAVLVRSGCAVWAHVGDSRLYLWRGGDWRPRDEPRLRQKTVDHASGAGLWLAVGPEPDTAVDVDWLPWLSEGDVLLLCSDGLTNMLRDEEIDRVLSRHRDDLEAAAGELIRRANEAGGRDNVSVVLVERPS